MIVAAFVLSAVIMQRPASGCPFCEAGSQTLSERIAAADVAVVARLVSAPSWTADDQHANRAAEKSEFRVEQLLKGEVKLVVSDPVAVFYFGESKPGAKFLLLGTQDRELLWSTPQPLSDRAVKYLEAALELPPEGAGRLAYFQKYLEDEDSTLARDAYEEFARAPYSVVVELKDKMDREQLVAWIRDPEVTLNHRRLYLTMLGVCGTDEDVPLLESMLLPAERESSAGLDALIACYVKLKGAAGLPRIEELFMKNSDAEFADTYAAIAALRFIGEQTEVVPRERVAQSFHHMLDRPEADLVVADLARWEDWSVMPRLVEIFKKADDESPWVRQTVARYLMACPLPEAKQHLVELKKIDVAAVERAASVLALLAGRGRAAPNDRPAGSDDAQTATAAQETDRPGSEGDAQPDKMPVAEDRGGQPEEGESSRPEEGAEEGEDGAADNEKDDGEQPPADDENEQADPAGGQAPQEDLEAEEDSPPPPSYAIVLGIPLAAGPVLLVLLWLVLGGLSNYPVRD
jgi:hypothetical protein